MANIRFLQIVDVAYAADKNRSLHALNMQNVISAFRDGSHSLIYVVLGREEITNLYIGLYKSNSHSQSQTEDYIQILKKAFEGNYSNIGLKHLETMDVTKVVLNPLNSFEYMAAITGIPSLKQEYKDIQVQGLERITNSMLGSNYMIMVIADPISEASVESVIQSCRELGSEIHSQVRSSFSAGTNENTSQQRNWGGSLGSGLFLGAGGILGSLMGFGYAFAPIMSGLMAGMNIETGRSETKSQGTSMSYSRDMLNKTAEFCEHVLDHYIERLQEGKNLGFWNTGIFLLTDSTNTLYRGQGVIRSVLAGEKTYFEPMRSFDLTQSSTELRASLLQFRNPLMQFPIAQQPALPANASHHHQPTPPPSQAVSHPLSDLFQALATPMNTSELSLVINLPREEVPGVHLSPLADFGLNPPATDGFELGNVIFRGKVTKEFFRIPPNSLTKHALITGITGSGKTNTCLALLRASQKNGAVPFLVIEPAKQEYRPLLADPVLGKGMQIFTLGDERISPFRINPFQFVQRFPVLTHIDLLKAVFNASFPMYASMPYILEEAILDVYTDRGWNLANSTNQYFDIGDDECDYTTYLPTLTDLYKKINIVVERKGYGKQLSMDMSAALKARIRSLMVGGKGMMLNCTRSFPLEQLFNRPTVMEMKYIGDDAEKAFLMALLLINLYEYCETERNYTGTLQHFTIIEEAHRLLKNIPPSLNAESANPRGKAVEMFADILAEIREYGEGFVIVDQVPAKLTPDALKNTNLKILHRIVAEDDRETVGNSMNLSYEQKAHVARLGVGQAIVHNEYLSAPILLQVLPAKDGLREHFYLEIGSDGLRKQMKVFQKEIQDVYRRWPACSQCPSPCAYLLEHNMPQGNEYEHFQNFINCLLVGTISESSTQWRSFNRLMEKELGKRLDGQKVELGIKYCRIAQLVHSTLSERLSYHQNGLGGFHAYILLEHLLQKIIHVLDADKAVGIEGLIQDFQVEMNNQIAVAPLRREQGCQYCYQRCRYGFMVQRDLTEKAVKLADRLKIAANGPGFSRNYIALVELLKTFSQDMTAFRVAPDHLHPLAFCYLVNSGAKKTNVLVGFQGIERNRK